MRDFNGKGTLDDRVNIVLGELALGIQWEKPSLILVIYRSEHIKNIVQVTLAKTLRDSGHIVLQYSVDKLHYDIPLDLLDHPKHQQAVFFVCGLRWGGGRGYSNSYRALNMHREYFIEGNIKAIFWLTAYEEKQLARFSPDFWAFRHKVVEFLDLPSIEGVKPLVSTKGSNNSLSTKKANDYQMRINTAERLRALGCIDESIQNFRNTLRKYPGETAINLKIAEIYLSMGRLSAAGRILKKANKGKTDAFCYSEELNHLNLVAKSMQPVCGGFSEQML